MIFNRSHYFTSGEQVSAMGVDVLGCGRSRTTGRAFRVVPRTLDCFGITMLEKGTGYFKSDSLPQTRLIPGDLFILFPGEEHCFGPGPSDFWQEYWLLFGGDTIRHLLTENHITPGRTLYRLGDGHPILSLLETTVTHAPDQVSRLPADILQILGYLGSRTRSADGSPVSAILAMVKEHPEAHHDFKRLAADHGISYSLFRRDCASQTGLAPQQYLIRERIHRARGYLAGGESVAEAGRLAGIDDQYYFSRMFKKVTGMSPRAFKNSIRSWKEGH